MSYFLILTHLRKLKVFRFECPPTLALFERNSISRLDEFNKYNEKKIKQKIYEHLLFTEET